MPHTFELFSQIWPRGLDNPELFLHCVFQIHRRLQVGQQVDPSKILDMLDRVKKMEDESKTEWVRQRERCCSASMWHWMICVHKFLICELLCCCFCSCRDDDDDDNVIFRPINYGFIDANPRRVVLISLLFYWPGTPNLFPHSEGARRGQSQQNTKSTKYTPWTICFCRSSSVSKLSLGGLINGSWTWCRYSSGE